MNPYSVILLDVDGTLVDSNFVHASAWIEALQKFGFVVALPKMIRLIGMGGDKIILLLTGLDVDGGNALAQAIKRERKELFLHKYVSDIKPFAKARELLERCDDLGYRLLTASSSDTDELEATLEVAGLREWVTIPLHKKTLPSKPDPDILLEALKQTDFLPEQAIMLGDTPYDMLAAEAAHVYFVGFLCGGWRRENLKRAMAIYPDPAALLEHFESSPFAVHVQLRPASEANPREHL